jgi:hypothetical protein
VRDGGEVRGGGENLGPGGVALETGEGEEKSFRSHKEPAVRWPRSTGQAQNGRHLSLAGPPRLLAPSIH